MSKVSLCYFLLLVIHAYQLLCDIFILLRVNENALIINDPIDFIVKVENGIIKDNY